MSSDKEVKKAYLAEINKQRWQSKRGNYFRNMLIMIIIYSAAVSALSIYFAHEQYGECLEYNGTEDCSPYKAECKPGDFWKFFYATEGRSIMNIVLFNNMFILIALLTYYSQERKYNKTPNQVENNAS